MTKKIKCILCEEKIEESERRFTRNNENVCESCFDYASSNSSKLIVFSPDSKEEISFDKNFVFFGDQDLLDEILKEVKWVSSGGWGGYTDFILNNNFLKIGEGWITGYPDESVSHKITGAKLFEKLNEKELTPLVDLFWLFGQTSNCFSSASTLAIRKTDEEKFRKWLKEINVDEKELEESFT